MSLSLREADIGRWIVTACGLVVLLIGLVVLLKVVREALDLYEDPSRIERLAAHIERGSNLDSNLAPREARPAPIQPTDQPTDQEAANGEPGADEQTPETSQMSGTGPDQARPSLRLSYFVAWIIELLLLLLIARIGLGAIRTGGELTLARPRPE